MALCQIRERDYREALIARGIPSERIQEYVYTFCGKNIDKQVQTMKIMIISEQPVNNLAGMEEFQRKLTEEKKAEVLCLRYTAQKADDIFREIRSQDPELLITVDLPGFEQCTLTDNVAYNLLKCKQFHLLLHENLPNELYLAKPLNISMFFYCVTEDCRERLTRRYPDLPYLKVLEGWKVEDGQPAQEHNARVLYAAYEEVLRESMLEV